MSDHKDHKEHEKHDQAEKKEKLDPNYFKKVVFLTAFAAILVINNFALASMGSIHALGLGAGGPGGGDYIITSVLNEDGRTAKLAALPTISQIAHASGSGDPTTDGIAWQLPTGTPFYAPEGVSFDDPVGALNYWRQMEKQIQVSPENQDRVRRLQSLATCDFCCGSPSRITISTQCGCSHAGAQRGLAAFFAEYYPDYSDEEIIGEIGRWKALWYPKPLVEYYLVYNGHMSPEGLRYGGTDGIRAQFS